MRARYVTMAMALILAASPAHAHIKQGEATGFLSGLAHPVSGLDHIIAMVAVGLWGAQLGAPAIWLLPVTFPMVMAFGGFLGLSASLCLTSRSASRSLACCSARPFSPRAGRRFGSPRL